MFFVLFAFACIVLATITNQYFEDEAQSTTHLACADYSCSVPLFNYAVQESQIPLHNHFVSKQVVVQLHNFWSGKE